MITLNICHNLNRAELKVLLDRNKTAASLGPNQRPETLRAVVNGGQVTTESPSCEDPPEAYTANILPFDEEEAPPR